MSLKPILFIINALLISSVFALGVNEHINSGEGFGYILPEYFYIAVAVGVLGVSVVWTFLHVLGGCLFGIAAGGLWDGIKLGLLLGLGLGLSRLWPYVMAWTAGIFAGNAPLLPILGWGFLAIILFGLNRMVMYFWNNIHTP